jgi:hypothetical protein
VLNLAPNSASTYVAYGTLRYYDLRGHRVFAELGTIPNTGSLMGLAAQIGLISWLHIDIKDGLVVASVNVEGTYVQKTIPYSTTMKFLAIEELGGRILFETSPDGVTFTPFHQVADPFDVSLVRIQLFAGTDNAIPAPGVARFASFNGTASSESACPTSALFDTFGDGNLGHLWENSFAGACCSATELNGRAHIALNGAPGYAGVRSAAGYDLREGKVAVALVGPSGSNAVASLVVMIDSKNSIELDAKINTFTARTTINNVGMNLMTTGRVAGQNYLQLREAGGMLAFEVSSDRIAWQTILTVPTPLPVDDVLVSLEAGIPSTLTVPSDEVGFDDLDTP